ncbi:MAG: glycosyltransferase family 4 protein [Planctomycetota bacterium]
MDGLSVFDYYGILPVFEVSTLPHLDVIPLQRFFPGSIFKSVYFSHGLLWGLRTALLARRQHADLYYTRDSETAFWLVRLHLPTVYEAHVVPRLGQRWLLKQIVPRGAMRLLVVLTSFIKTGFVEIGCPEQKIIVSPDGVDLSLFDGLPSREECRKRLGLPLDRVIIGYIGRFQTMGMEKGIPQLVQAMQYVKPVEGKEPLLLCVGGPLNVIPAYLALARSCGAVERRLRFIDRVSNIEVPFWIRACDVATIPWPWNDFSAYYTSPLKLFEYMGAGTPIVASDLPSLREVLRHGENAWLVEPGNPEELAQGLQRILSDRILAQKLAQEARQDVVQYSWQKRAATILNRL